MRVWELRTLAATERGNVGELRPVAMRLVPWAARGHEGPGPRVEIPRSGWGGLGLGWRCGARSRPPTATGLVPRAALMREGYPAWTTVLTMRHVEVWRRWAPGTLVQQIAAVVVCGRCRSGEATRELPERWTAARVCQEFAWSRENLPQRLRRASFPDRDGISGTGSFRA